MWLNEKFIEKGLDHKNLLEITTKYNPNHRKHRYELVEETKKQVSRIFKDEKLAINIITNFRTTMAHKFRTRLEFKQCDVILTKEQSVLTKIMSSFEQESMQTQYKVLSYSIDLNFHAHKPAIETDENGHNNRNIDYKIKRQKAID